MKGGISLLGNEDEPIFRGYVHEFGLGLPHFYWPNLVSVRQESIVMIIKHHTYTHCTLRLYINTQTFQHLPVNKM